MRKSVRGNGRHVMNVLCRSAPHPYISLRLKKPWHTPAVLPVDAPSFVVLCSNGWPKCSYQYLTDMGRSTAIESHYFIASARLPGSGSFCDSFFRHWKQPEYLWADHFEPRHDALTSYRCHLAHARSIPWCGAPDTSTHSPSWKALVCWSLPYHNVWSLSTSSYSTCSTHPSPSSVSLRGETIGVTVTLVSAATGCGGKW